jgi:hypothetical protein
MLAALSIVAVTASFYAPLQAGFPTMLNAQLPLLAVLLNAMTLCAALAHLITHRQAAGAVRAADDRLRLEQIYAPIAVLFVRRHVTACTGVSAPRLKHRLSNAWTELFRYRRAFVGVRRALRAIGDRQESTSAEVEYGGDFPMKEIHARVVANPALAGPVLLNMVRRADRSRYEDGPGSGLLTDEEYALFEHIHAEHHRLAKRFA